MELGQEFVKWFTVWRVWSGGLWCRIDLDQVDHGLLAVLGRVAHSLDGNQVTHGPLGRGQVS